MHCVLWIHYCVQVRTYRAAVTMTYDIFGNRKINKCLDYEVTTKSDGIVLDFNRVKSGPHVLMPGS